MSTFLSTLGKGKVKAKRSIVKRLIRKAIQKPKNYLTNPGPSSRKKQGSYAPTSALRHPAVSMYLKAKNFPEKIKRGSAWRKTTARAIKELRNK